jgi:hypothetical protein
LGDAWATVEVDLADDTLLILGRTELGTDPREVEVLLRGWWEGWPQPSRADEHRR